jgi:thioredoxin reductase (NADPH)
MCDRRRRQLRRAGGAAFRQVRSDGHDSHARRNARRRHVGLLIKEVGSTANIVVRARTTVSAVDGGSRLEGLTLSDRQGSRRVAADALFIMIGAEPYTDWLPVAMERDGHGFVMTGRDLVRTGRTPVSWPLDRPPFESETSVPGVFAVGDLRSGSVERIAAAVGAGSAVVQYVHEYLRTTVTA